MNDLKATLRAPRRVMLLILAATLTSGSDAALGASRISSSNWSRTGTPLGHENPVRAAGHGAVVPPGRPISPARNTPLHKLCSPPPSSNNSSRPHLAGHWRNDNRNSEETSPAKNSILLNVSVSPILLTVYQCFTVPRYFSPSINVSVSPDVPQHVSMFQHPPKFLSVSQCFNIPQSFSMCVNVSTSPNNFSMFLNVSSMFRPEPTSHQDWAPDFRKQRALL